MQYRKLAVRYDALMSHIDYGAWADRFLSLAGGVAAGGTVLDLACGTGNLGAALASRGYDVIGVDASADMLSVAYQKGAYSLLVCQDLAELDLYGTSAAAFSSLDSFNYITNPADLQTVFDRILLFLDPNAPLVFDMRPEKFYKDVAGRRLSSYGGGKFASWVYDYDPEKRLCEINLSDGFETHRQRAYDPAEIAAMLKKSGYADILTEEDEDRFFVRGVKPFER